MVDKVKSLRCQASSIPSLRADAPRVTVPSVMDTHHNDDDERDWFEPVESTHHPEIMNHLGWMGAMLQPEKRTFLLGALIGLTLIGGLSAGVFDGREAATDIEAGRTDGSPTASPVSAQSMLQDHMAQSPITAKMTATAKTAPSKNTPSKIALEKDDGKVEKKTDDAPIETINLTESLKLGKDALASKHWSVAVDHLEKASRAWKKKQTGKAWRDLRYGLSKAYYKTDSSGRTVTIIEALLKSDPKWDKPLLLLGLAAKVDQQHVKAVKYLSSYLERGGTKVSKVCPYLEEHDAVDSGSEEVQEACAPE
jgi:hypothetical protein